MFYQYKVNILHTYFICLCLVSICIVSLVTLNLSLVFPLIKVYTPRVSEISFLNYWP